MGLVVSPDGSVVSTVPSPVVRLRETVSLVSRALEDANWNNLSQDDGRRSLDEDPDDRRKLILRARAAVKQNPLARQAVDLLQHYVLGQGLTVKAANKSLVAKLVDEFWEHPENKAVLTTHDAQKELLERLFVDGDVFPTLFADKEKGIVTVGWLDALDVVDIIPAENNRKIPKWYKVKAPTSKYDFANGTWTTAPTAGGEFIYYRHWMNEDEPPAGMPNGAVQEGIVYQVSVDKTGLFGRSKLATAIDWLRAHREFMEDRSTLNRAAASIAWKKKRTGPASDIAREVERLQSSIVGNPSRYESNPTRATASTVVENQGSSMDWVETDTGGAAADYDERKIRMMAGSGMGGVPNHYFGDVADANLATATAMELPLLKTYEDYQQVVRGLINDILHFYLTVAHGAGRVGEDDQSDRYAEHMTTPQGVMEQPDQVNVDGTSSAKPATGTKVREAFGAPKPGGPLPYAPPPLPGGIRMIPRPDAMPEDEEPEEITPTSPVSWYIDVDFPPIVSKELFPFMQALEKFAAMLPAEVLDAKKLVTELALQAFGVNNIDREMERIYPSDMVGVLMPSPPPLPEEQPGGPAGFGESASIADIRRHRALRLVREAATAVATG